MASPAVDFYFDYSSPFAYLGATQIARIAEEQNATLTYKPMLLGGLFKSIGTPIVPLMDFTEAKRTYYLRDLERWAEHWGVSFKLPSRFPMNTVGPLRLTLAVASQQPPALAPLIDRIFRAYWVEDKNISDTDVLASILTELELDPVLLESIQDPTIKASLRDATDAAVQLGVCGAPTSVVDGMLFWGQDRMNFVERALKGWRPPCG